MNFSQREAAGKMGAGMLDDAPTRSAYLKVEHATVSGGERKVLRIVNDSSENCDVHLRASFRDAALSLTDLDADGIGEITFAYSLSCASDVSPSILKLLMLENGDKYILRGTTRVQDSPTHRTGGEYREDASFKNAPKSFLDHAKSQWLKVRDD